MAKLFENLRKNKIANFDEKSEIQDSIPKQCEGMHCVDLGESIPTRLISSTRTYIKKGGSDTDDNEPSKVGRDPESPECVAENVRHQIRGKNQTTQMDPSMMTPAPRPRGSASGPRVIFGKMNSISAVSAPTFANRYAFFSMF